MGAAVYYFLPLDEMETAAGRLLSKHSDIKPKISPTVPLSILQQHKIQRLFSEGFLHLRHQTGKGGIFLVGRIIFGILWYCSISDFIC